MTFGKRHLRLKSKNELNMCNTEMVKLTKTRQRSSELTQTKGHHVPVRWPQRKAVQSSAMDYGQKEWIRWNQQNNWQDCVKNEEVDGQ